MRSPAQWIRETFSSRAISVDPRHPRDPTLVDMFGSRETTSGVAVTPESAAALTAVSACVRVLAESVGSLPLILYRRMTPRGKQRATDHPLYTLLHDAPNPEMTSFEFRETLMGHLALRGNAYAEIERDARGNAVRLWPLPANIVTPKRVDGLIVYKVRLPDGGLQTLFSDQVLHLRTLGKNGIIGDSVITQHRDALGLTLASEEYGARFFANDSSPRGILEHPVPLDPEARENLKKSWEFLHKGLSNAHRIRVLEGGMKWTQIGISPEDAQFLETRKFQTREVARMFRMQPHKIGDLDNATFSNIEEQNLEFVTDTLRPWLVRWEQAILQRLIRADERKTLFAEHLVDGLLRGNTLARFQSYAIARTWGFLSADDIRELENQNPLPDGKGDVYLQPLNMVEAGTQPGPQPPPTRALERPIERRATGLERHRVAERSLPLFEDAAGRVVRAEVREVTKAARQMLTQRSEVDFADWLARFYAIDGDHAGFAARTLQPSYQMLVDEVHGQAALEINVEPDSEFPGVLAASLALAFASRQVHGSLVQLGSVLSVGAAEGDALSAIEQRLSEWSERRAGKIARRESVQGAAAAAKETFKANGVRQLRWVTFGKNCPLCDSFNGRIVGIDDGFAQGGEALAVGEMSPLKIRRRITHPPLHRGCDCSIVAA